MTAKESLAKAERLRLGGQLDKAAEAYRQYLAVVPLDLQVRRKRAELLLKVGNADGAISEYFKIQETLSDAGDILGAIAAGQKILQIDPKCSHPLSYVAQVQTESLEQQRKRIGKQTVPYEPIKRLPEIPLLADLLPDELAAVAANMEVHERALGEVIFAEGDKGDSLFFVTRGTLEVTAGSQKLGTLKAGDCFGEFSFLTGQPRTATVRVVEAVELLELSTADVKTVVTKYPRVRDVLFKLYRERAMENVLACSPLFAKVSRSEREKLIAQVELVTLQAGETLFRQGTEGHSIFLIKSGQVEVRAKAPGGSKEVRLALLGPHQFFGEVAFLARVPRTATIRAMADCELWKLDEKELALLVREHPDLMNVLQQYHLDRVMATAETLKSFLKQSRVDGIFH